VEARDGFAALTDSGESDKRLSRLSRFSSSSGLGLPGPRPTSGIKGAAGKLSPPHPGRKLQSGERNLAHYAREQVLGDAAIGRRSITWGATVGDRGWGCAKGRAGQGRAESSQPHGDKGNSSRRVICIT
jgi:hypothetical protein